LNLIENYKKKNIKSNNRCAKEAVIDIVNSKIDAWDVRASPELELK
jgi:hypothetical protein